MQNALKYSPDGGHVGIVYDGHSVHVEDQGPGVPETELDNIFRPFYRIDSARARETGGTGLGLAIVARSMAAHGGRAFATLAPGGGSKGRWNFHDESLRMNDRRAQWLLDEQAVFDCNHGSYGACPRSVLAEQQRWRQTGGIISANVSGLTLNVDPSASGGLINQGTMQATNGGVLRLNGFGGGTFTNSGTIKALSGGTITTDGTVTSSGTVDVGAESLTVTGSGTYTQSAGTFRLAGGTVTSSTALLFNGGLVDARGTINAAITNGANLQPALGGSGLVVNGNVTLLSSSKLTFQLAGLTQGSQYGFLNVNGTAALNGNLVVSFVDPFQANNNDNFTVLSSTALSGAFTNVASGSRLTVTDNSGTFLVTYNGTTVVLSDFQPSGQTPGNSSTGKSSRPPEGDAKKNSEGDMANKPAAAPRTPKVAETPRRAADPSIATNSESGRLTKARRAQPSPTPCGRAESAKLRSTP